MRLWAVFILVFLPTAALPEESIRLGIFGTVDRATPLVVAGQEIDVPAGVSVISVLGPGQEITVGDTLAIAAVLLERRLTALRILEVYPVVGPVSAVQGNTATILGSPIHIPPDTEIKVGQTFAISGLWSGEKAITSNLKRIEGRFAQLTGMVSPDMLKIGGSTLISAEPPVGGYGNDVWILSGQPEMEGLRVRFMSKGIFGKPADLIWWQGYASQPIASQTFMIHGTGITGAARDSQMPTPGALIARCVQDGRIVKTPPKGLDLAFEALGCARHILAD
ncbi:hypothetical protein [uncultured Sulfitobacter sp.]|uniref:hypothetical protein n=1 Tax=uncultured Sulfitobacter sp. TaxID=191468 RepID=UPI00262CEA3E|nr:hypothetical protein [uncultured Sulfitobacter sp.]